MAVSLKIALGIVPYQIIVHPRSEWSLNLFSYYRCRSFKTLNEYLSEKSNLFVYISREEYIIPVEGVFKQK